MGWGFRASPELAFGGGSLMMGGIGGMGTSMERLGNAQGFGQLYGRALEVEGTTFATGVGASALAYGLGLPAAGMLAGEATLAFGYFGIVPTATAGGLVAGGTWAFAQVDGIFRSNGMSTASMIQAAGGWGPTLDNVWNEDFMRWWNR
jgi:hypothetical protein